MNVQKNREKSINADCEGTIVRNNCGIQFGDADEKEKRHDVNSMQYFLSFIQNGKKKRLNQS